MFHPIFTTKNIAGFLLSAAIVAVSVYYYDVTRRDCPRAILTYVSDLEQSDKDIAVADPSRLCDAWKRRVDILDRAAATKFRCKPTIVGGRYPRLSEDLQDTETERGDYGLRIAKQCPLAK